MNEASKASLSDFLKKNQTTEPAPVEAVTPQVEPEKVSQPTEVTQEPRKVEEPTVLENWDTTAPAEEPKEPVTTPEPYHVQIAKKVGLELKDEEELIARLKADPYEGVPTNLKKAIELAKKGGDYLQLLKVSQIDYNALDPVQIYEADVLSKAEDKQAAQEYLAAISPIQKQIEGNRLKQQYVYQQQAQEQALIREVENAKAQTEQTRQRYTSELHEALNKTEAIEVGGYKLKLDARHKKQLANAITSSEFWNDPRYKNQKGFDLEKKIRDEFVTSNWDTVQNFLKDRAKTETLKEIQNEVQNVDLEKNTARDQVEVKKTPVHERIKFDQSWRK